ncbi:hypothetical protein J2Y69_003052 [Microbacterium resistens]|uniref:Holin n=1 Tax=Microbacterium resistens TaxID=156977 RepID=A0ABU1SFR0_9MICO|nr:hypothetical protein [Microbacterium resistens]MDR6868436.1 hypothetical protein [Microbacterium resistens]
MTTDPLIPVATVIAAKRGFLRTAANALASAIPIGAIAIGTTGDFWIGVGLGAAGAIASSILAGTASALSILSKGIPSDYSDVALVKLSALDADEQHATLDGARGRALLRRDLR